MNEFGEVMTILDVAKYLKVSAQVVRKLDLPRIRFGKIIRFKKSDVDIWLDTNKEVKQ